MATEDTKDTKKRILHFYMDSFVFLVSFVPD